MSIDWSKLKKGAKGKWIDAAVGTQSYSLYDMTWTFTEEDAKWARESAEEIGKKIAEYQAKFATTAALVAPAMEAFERRIVERAAEIATAKDGDPKEEAAIYLWWMRKIEEPPDARDDLVAGAMRVADLMRDPYVPVDVREKCRRWLEQANELCGPCHRVSAKSIPLSAGDHIMFRLNPVEEQRHLVVEVNAPFVTIRPIGADGSLLAAADWNIDWTCDSAKVRKVDPIPTREPRDTRGRCRLKPGHSL